MDGADAAKNRGSAQDHGGDGEQFVAPAGIGPGLADAGNINQRGEGCGRSRQHVGQREPSRDGNSGVTGALRREANGSEAATEHGAMNQQPDRQRHERQNGDLRGHMAEQIALAEEEERFGEIGEVIDTAGDGLGQTAKKRERAERDDQRGQFEAGDQEGVQAAARRAHGQRAAGGGEGGEMGVSPEFAE